MKQTILFLFVIMTGCSANNKFFSDGEKWIPADFDPAESVLLVEHFPGKEKWNTDMIHYLDEIYPGKYIVVSKEDIVAIQGKYKDKKKYRYAVLWGTINSRSNSSRQSGNVLYYYSDPKIDFSGHFLERETGREYPVTSKYNNYGSKGYIPFFNSVIKYTK